MNKLQQVLKPDHQDAILHSLIYPIIFTSLMFIFNRDSITALLFIFTMTFFYTEELLKRVREKEKLLGLLPITAKQFIDTLYTLELKFFLSLALVFLPIYTLIAYLEPNRSPFSEHVLIYISICSICLIVMFSMLILHYFIQRTLLLLSHLALIIIITLVYLFIALLLEDLGFHSLLVACITVIITVVTIFLLHRQTIHYFRNFNL